MTGAVTRDGFLGGRIVLAQPAHGYRAGLDAVLLAASVEAKPGMRLLEVGCGAGAALLCVAARATSNLIGVEREPRMAALAQENVAQNGFSGRVVVVEGDALSPLDLGGPFDGVFCNPPFDDEGAGPVPSAARRHAYLSEHAIDVWVRRLADRLSGGAALTMIQRAHRLGGILAACEGRLGGVEVLPLRPKAGAPAKRVLVRARKGVRAPLRLYGGLDLHDDAGAKHAPLVEAILRGEAGLDWA